MPKFCLGCGNCFVKSEKTCPHFQYTDAFIKKVLNADLLVFANPVYVYHTTGQMKALLDHFGYMWLVHRPYEEMFRKQAVVISTAAGAGTKSANKDIIDSLYYWGVPKIYSYGVNVASITWDNVTKKKKDKIDRDMSKLAKKIKPFSGKIKLQFRAKFYFALFRMLHKKGMTEVDQKYWKEKGWLDKKRPYKIYENN